MIRRPRRNPRGSDWLSRPTRPPPTHWNWTTLFAARRSSRTTGGPPRMSRRRLWSKTPRPTVQRPTNTASRSQLLYPQGRCSQVSPRPIRSFEFSRRRGTNSARSSVASPGWSPQAWRAWRALYGKVVVPIPRSQATWATRRLPSCANATSSALNTQMSYSQVRPLGLSCLIIDTFIF